MGWPVVPLTMAGLDMAKEQMIGQSNSFVQAVFVDFSFFQIE